MDDPNKKYSIFMDNLIDEIINRDSYYCDYMKYPREESEIDRDCLLEAIENNPKLSDKQKRVLDYVYSKNMKYKDIAKIEGVSVTSIRYTIYAAVNIIMHKYFVIKADKEKNWTYLQDLDLSNLTFNTLRRRGVVLIKDMYDRPCILNEMYNGKTKKEIFNALKSKGFGLTIFK